MGKKRERWRRESRKRKPADEGEISSARMRVVGDLAWSHEDLDHHQVMAAITPSSSSSSIIIHHHPSSSITDLY
jgi:hypothetical protein